MFEPIIQYLIPFSDAFYVSIYSDVSRSLSFVEFDLMHYLSVIDSSLGAEKKLHIQVEEIGLFSFFLIILFECGLKTYKKYHLSTSRTRTSLFIHLKYTA